MTCKQLGPSAWKEMSRCCDVAVTSRRVRMNCKCCLAIACRLISESNTVHELAPIMKYMADGLVVGWENAQGWNMERNGMLTIVDE